MKGEINISMLVKVTDKEIMTYLKYYTYSMFKI